MSGEKNGYLRFTTEMTFTDGTGDEGLVYIATEENEAYLGGASEFEIARPDRRCNRTQWSQRRISP